MPTVALADRGAVQVLGYDATPARVQNAAGQTASLPNFAGTALSMVLPWSPARQQRCNRKRFRFINIAHDEKRTYTRTTI
jgi:hypothetical protein